MFSLSRWGDTDNNLPQAMGDCLASSMPLNCSVATEIASLFLLLLADTSTIQKPSPSMSYSSLLDALIV